MTLNQLTLLSFKAQAKYVSSRIHNKSKKKYFDDMINTMLTLDPEKYTGPRFTPTEGQQMAIDLFADVYDSMKLRFETGYLSPTLKQEW